MICAAAVACVPVPSPALMDQTSPLTSRVAAKSLKVPMLQNSVPGILSYPPWLAGDWQCTTRAKAFAMPCGSKFVDPYLIKVASRDVQAANKLHYKLHFDKKPADGAPSGLTVIADRLRNTIEEEGAFIAARGYTVERGSYSCNADHPHGRVVLDVLEGAKAPALNGEGPRTDKVFEVRLLTRSKLEFETVWAASEETVAADGTKCFVTSELCVQRALFPDGSAGSSRGSYEVFDTQFLELITRYELPPPATPAGVDGEDHPESIRASYRIAQYLGGLPGVATSPQGVSQRSEVLERQAAGRAIALLDYDLLLTKR